MRCGREECNNEAFWGVYFVLQAPKEFGDSVAPIMTTKVMDCCQECAVSLKAHELMNACIDELCELVTKDIIDKGLVAPDPTRTRLAFIQLDDNVVLIENPYYESDTAQLN